MGCSFFIGCASGIECSEVGGGRVKTEDDPEGKIIVGSSGETLRPPGEVTTSTQINSLLV